MARTPSRLACALAAAAFTAAALPTPAAAQEPDLCVPPGVVSGCPEISVPQDIVTDATSAVGAQVFYIVTAKNDTAPLFLTCTGPSGGVFPLGTTPVTCVALDWAGNSNAKSFNITVNPGSATAALSGAVNLVLASSLDFATQGALVALLNDIATPPTTSRKCAKVDPTKDRADLTNGKLGNRDSCLEKDVAKAQHAFTDFVQDAGKSKQGTPPTITPAVADALLAAASAVATTTIVGATNTPPVLAIAGNVTTKLPPPDLIAAGATSVIYTDRNNPPPNLLAPQCKPPSGTQFPVGTTTITCTASTTGGTTTKSFTVTVQPH